VFPASLVAYQNDAVVSTWTVDGPAGRLRWNTAPAVDVQITAKYKCRFKAYFYQDGDVLYEQTDQFKSFADRGITIREFPY
jgi:hypothetical protein